MIMIVSMLVLQAVHTGEVQVWPVTVAGWATLVLAFLGVLGALYSYAKTMVHLNGLGERVTAVEQRQERSEEREQEFIRSLDRVTSAQNDLLKEIGRAHAGAASCSEEMKDYAIDIGAKVDDLRKTVNDLRKTVNDEGRHAGERLQALETEVSLTRRAIRRENE